MDRRTRKIGLLMLLSGFILQGHAVELSQNGLGEALIYPLVVADSGDTPFDTLFRVTNRSADSAAALAVLRNGDTGEALLEWIVLLNSYDSWSAALTTREGGFAVVINDRSCVAPAAQVPAGGGLPSYVFEAPVGHFWIEILELGAFADTPLFADQATLCDSYANGVELSPAANRLRGDAHLISVSQGLSFHTPPAALRDLGMEVPALPLEPGQIDFSQAAPVAVIDGIETIWTSGVDAVSAALSVVGVETTFSALAELGGKTDLVLTFPTRHFYDVESGEQPFPINTMSEHSEQGAQVPLAVADLEGYRFDLNGLFPKCTPVPPPPTQEGPVVSSSQSNFFIARHDEAPLLDVTDSELAGIFVDGATCGLLYQPIRGWNLEGVVSANFSAYELKSENGYTVVGMPVLFQSLSVITNGTLVDERFETPVRANYGLVNSVNRVTRVVETEQ